MTIEAIQRAAPILTIAGIAKRAGVDPGNLRRYVLDGRLPDHIAAEVARVLSEHGVTLAE